MPVRINNRRLEELARNAARKRDDRIERLAQAKMNALAADTQLGQDKLALARRTERDNINQRNLQRLHELRLQNDKQDFLHNESNLTRDFNQNESNLERLSKQKMQQERLNSASDLQARKLNYLGNQADLDRTYKTNERIADQKFKSDEARKRWIRKLQTPIYDAPQTDSMTGQVIQRRNINPLAKVPKELSVGSFDNSDFDYFTGNSSQQTQTPTIEANKKKKKIAPPSNFAVYSGLQGLKDMTYNSLIGGPERLYKGAIRPALKWLSSPY